MNKRLIVVRGGGDLATGTIHRLWSAGFQVVVLETEAPAAIRRQVSVCEAVYAGETVIEGMTARLARDPQDAEDILAQGEIPVLIDPSAKSLAYFQPEILVDAIIAKKNLGTSKDMAPVTIALGPGFEAGVDVDYVIETKRGHDLGRVIRSGYAVKNSGVPGNIGGYTSERVMKSPAAGEFVALREIGDIVAADDVIGEVILSEETACEAVSEGASKKACEAASRACSLQLENDTYNKPSRVPVITTIPGILRGILKSGYQVTEGFKLADVDPRISELKNCFTISDKARCIAGSVLELCVANLYK